MTLALTLLVVVSSVPAAPPVKAPPAQSAAQTTTTVPPQGATKAQDQGAVPAQNPSPASKSDQASSSAQTSSTQNQPAPPKRPRRKKKPKNVNCVLPPATADSTTTPSDPSARPGAPPAATGSAPADGKSAAATPPSNCPPPKIVVRQGGTTEPSIQLAGGAVGNQAAQQRETANRILKSAEDNLTRIAGRQLSPNQQEMVNQIHQFIEQSRSAIAAGELERARTLASKAQQLSQDLAQPPQ